MISKECPCYNCCILGFCSLRYLPKNDSYDSYQTEVSGLNPTLMISLGCILGIPMFVMVFLILKHFGVEATVFSAEALDVGAALLIGKLNLGAGIELAVITVFVYVGIRVALSRSSPETLGDYHGRSDEGEKRLESMAISGQQIYSHVKFLCDVVGNRNAGTRGILKFI